VSNHERAGILLPLLVWAMLIALTAWIYWPGIDGPALLDDRASVQVLDELDDKPEYALDFVLGDKAGPLGRPVSMLSFVLEKLYLNEGIRGGKKLNIVLHLINGSLVMWLVALLLGHIRIPARMWLALLVASAWLLSPLYVSTVLYVVQRMAMLATLFMLAACLSYVHWRLAIIRQRRSSGYLLLVLVFSILAVFSKENAIVVLPVLLLMECLWFQFAAADGRILRGVRTITLGAIVVGATFIVLFFTLRYTWLVDSYVLRSFTLNERLLTESRILWDYVGQLLYPDVRRMGLYHDDIAVSKTLLQPVTTLYAVLAWLGVLLVSAILLRWRRGRYLVFAAALFLIGHITESTILPLELYYEHRNYFPGLGIFLGIALVLGFLFQKWPEIVVPVMAWAGMVILLLAARTSSQIQIWSSAPLLYLTHLSGHPHSFRANADMASLLAEAGALQAALEYSAKAHQAKPNERQGDYDIRDLALSCTVNQPLPQERVAAMGLVSPERPLSSVSTLNVLVRNLQDNICPNFDRIVFADRMAALFLDDEVSGSQYQAKAAPNIYASLAILENALERYDNAYQYTERFLLGSPDNIQGLLMKLHFATALQKTAEIASVLAKLRAREELGELTVAEQQTLSLYREG